MPAAGPLDHIDLSVSDPARSIPFYAALLEALGYRRVASDATDFAGASPQRAWWALDVPGQVHFGIEVRPSRGENRSRRYDRYAPGPHHLAFHAESREHVDRVHEALRAAGAEILDPPADYSGQPGYGDGYYALFVADPDGLKLEVVHNPLTNP